MCFGLPRPTAFFGLIRLAHSFKKNKKKNKEEFGRVSTNGHETKALRLDIFHQPLIGRFLDNLVCILSWMYWSD